MMALFDYMTAFSRNIGWVTEEEQKALRGKRVAIAGLGGVGGHHVMMLARLGISNFSLAEFDRVELANFNRQACATLSSVGEPKLDIVVSGVRDINPEVNIRQYEQGINDDNIDAFLEGADLYIDGLDFFVLEERRKIFAACAKKGIPAMTTAPLGMGAAHLNFLPGLMTFEEYFAFDGATGFRAYVKFLTGLSPAMLQRGYLKDWSRVDFTRKKGPSTPMSCYLCAGVAGVEALKILLKRKGVLSAPHGFHFDSYRNRFVRTWRPWGNRNWIQRIVYATALKQLVNLYDNKEK